MGALANPWSTPSSKSQWSGMQPPDEVHDMNPPLQVIPQLGPLPAQVELPFAVVGQAVHDVPHELTLVLLEHLVPQA